MDHRMDVSTHVVSREEPVFLKSQTVSTPETLQQRRKDMKKLRLLQLQRDESEIRIATEQILSACYLYLNSSTSLRFIYSTLVQNKCLKNQHKV